jgi:hypothetical protein
MVRYMQESLEKRLLRSSISLFKGDAKAKAMIFDAQSPLIADGWEIEKKNWK